MNKGQIMGNAQLYPSFGHGFSVYLSHVNPSHPLHPFSGIKDASGLWGHYWLAGDTFPSTCIALNLGKKQYLGFVLFFFFFFMECRWGWGRALPVTPRCRDLTPAWKKGCPKILGFKNIFHGLIEWKLVQKWRRGFPSGCGWKWGGLLVNKKIK